MAASAKKELKKVKKEQKAKGTVKVKKEPGTEDDKKAKKSKKGPGTGFARGAKVHYCHQAQFIDSQVTTPWKVCFGGLGSGIVGVCPTTAKEENAKKVKKEPQVKKEPGAEKSSSSSSKAVPIKEEKDETDGADEGASGIYKIPENGTVIIFINSAGCALMQRNQRMLGSYEETLDVENKTFTWSSQRCDRHNTKINAIISHCNRGGRVVCGVRPAVEKTFRFLGNVSLMDGLQESCFLVQEGDSIIQELGACIYHRAISAQCLSVGLRSGIGLRPAKYPLVGNMAKNAKFCQICCTRPPKAVLHFDELDAEGCKAFQVLPTTHVKDQKRELPQDGLKAKAEDVAVKIEKRLRGKQPLVKIEPED